MKVRRATRGLLRRCGAALWASLIVWLWFGRAEACGPEFPYGFVYDGSESSVFRMPQAHFSYEFGKSFGGEPDGLVHPKLVNRWAVTLDADAGDLKAALEEEGLDPDRVVDLVQQYQAFREAMKAHADGSTADTYWPDGHPDEEKRPRNSWNPTTRPDSEPFDFTPYADLLAALPKEFVLYAKGAAAYRTWDYEEAFAQWRELLDLPRKQRQYRSTWAAFMAGKALLYLEPAKAGKWFEKTRDLAGKGFCDSADLAGASRGWEARAAMDTGQYVEAMHLYFDLFEGESEADRRIGYQSILFLCGRAVRDDACLNDKLCRRILTLWAMSGEGVGADGKAWLNAMKTSGVDVEPELAGYLAWAAYRSGDMEGAGDWVEKAGADSPYAQWVKAKLLLREGDFDGALEILHVLEGLFPQEDAWPMQGSLYQMWVPKDMVQGEAGVLLLERRDYIAALEAFLCGYYLPDAAYVAERVLTLDEVSKYIATHEDDPELSKPNRMRWGMEWLSYLHGRRLARAGKWEAAQEYYPGKEGAPGEPEEHAGRNLHALSEEMRVHLKQGRDKSNPAEARAEHLFEAGRIMRSYGMELTGTTVEPDWFCEGGALEAPGGTRHRLAEQDKERCVSWVLKACPPHSDRAPLREKLMGLLVASEDEKARLAAHVVKPEKRFHYRYRAADLMWECASLLPDNDELTAKALYFGGTFLANRDPEAADRFYKALVRRCGKLPIGQEADKQRWFPPKPEEWEEDEVESDWQAR